MAENDQKKKDFSDVLEQGSKEDDFFKDTPAPLGSDPFQVNEASTTTTPEFSLEEPIIGIEPVMGTESTTTTTPEFIQATPSIFDNDQQICLNRKFAAIESLFHLVTKECSFAEMTNEILRIAIEQIPSEAGTLFEQDYQNQCLFFRAVAGRSSESLLSVTVPLGYGVVGFVCENQQPMVLSHVEDNQKYLRSISDSVGFEAKNVIAYPIVIRGMTFGCLELLNRLGETTYSEADQEVLATICEHAARVIENRLLLALAGSAQPKREAA